MSAITPSKKRKPLNDPESIYPLDTIPPALTPSSSSDSDSDGLVIINSESSEEMTPEEKMGGITKQWESVVNGLNRLTGAFKRFRSSMLEELETSDDRITATDARIGNPAQGVEFEDCITAWDGILYTQGGVEDLRRDLEDVRGDLVQEYTDSTAAFVETKTATSEAFEVVNGHIDELATVVRALSDEQAVMNSQIQLNSSPVSEAAFRELQAEVRRLQRNAASAAAADHSAGVGSSAKADAEIAALKIQLNILSSRIPLDATMSLGGHIFKSKGDVQLFVEHKMSTNLFHLCHDPITLLESLTGVHVEKKDVLNEMYQADRVGMNDAEARHCASFRLILPTVFGYVKEGASTRHNLPAVRSFKDWNPRDGTSGVKAYIATGLDDLKLQVRTEIEDSFPPDESEAKSLARDMHDGSQTFLSELMAFSGDFFDELMHSSDTTEEEAWELLSALIKRIFEEFRKAEPQLPMRRVTRIQLPGVRLIYGLLSKLRG
jgi:hypothetical protein